MTDVLRLHELAYLRDITKRNEELEREHKKGSKMLDALQEEVANLRRKIAALTPE
jgi:hypothetical protein